MSSTFSRRPGRNGRGGVNIPDIDVEREMKNVGAHMSLLGVGGLVLVLVILAQGLPTFYTDYLWFQSMGQGSVFVTRLVARIGIFAVAALVSFVFFMGNVWVARRLAPASFVKSGGVMGLAVFVGLVIALFTGLVAQAQWETLLRFANATSFEMADPIFGRDVSFYVFALPVYSLVQVLLTALCVVTAAGVAVIYMAALGRLQLTSGIKAHLSALGAVFLLLYAWNYQISIANLAYSLRGVVAGASYTDVHAQWPAYTILTWLTVLAALILLANVVLRATKALAATAVVWLVVTIVLAQGYPTFVQNFQVRPNESVKEKPYIENNIKFTRYAFGLDTIMDEPFAGEGAPSTADINRNVDTVNDIRLWDYRPLLDTYGQLQSIRPYYDFRDVDIDRYMINGKYRQVMISARELTQSQLPVQAQTWVNQKLVYTHGYGVAMSPVNEILADGSPNFFVKNIPPAGQVEVKRGGIYIGEKQDGYVIVKTRMPEFDYPLGDQNAMTRYDGADGVGVGGLFNRLLFAIRFSDINMLLSDAIQADSRVLMHRNIRERIELLAPFLTLDDDPYITIVEGKLVWLQDAYMVTNRFPFSQPYSSGINYIRNSVKVAVDAYDGTTTFYVVDEDDPLIKAWQGIFPTLFTPLSEMPAALRSHIRYPEDIFMVQAEMLRTYHMEDAQVFYNKEDLWSVPREIYADKEQKMEPYFAIMRLPQGKSEEFILLLPFTPNNKQNMVAWLGAKSDGDRYGQRVLYQMPKDRLVYGPMQVEARITQDTEISAQITLWSQSGSIVTRGNLLIIPIENSFLYVEPLYLRAERGQIPQLKRVIVSTANAVAMDENLGLALRKLFSGVTLAGSAPGTTPVAPGGQQPAQPTSIDVAALIRSASQQYQQAQDALKVGDWAGYGEAQKALEATLNRLLELTNK